MVTTPWEPCGYGCGKPWRRWKGTKLIGHAKCALSEAEQDALLQRMEDDPRLTLAVLAERYGVTPAVVIAWQRYALRRRAARRKAGGP